jgi:hypothetical protein
MNNFQNFGNTLGQSQRRVISRLTSPSKIQSFLDGLTYNSGERVRCPLNVLRDGVAHCFEGAVFAAALLRQLGHRPLILNMFPEPDIDDEHVIAIYRVNQGWGALAKSGYLDLRYREPIYRSLRELVMSYFEHYFNLSRQKSLRTYARPLNLASLDRHGWLTRDEAMDVIHERLDTLKQIPLLSPPMRKHLCLVDAESYRRGPLVTKLVGRPPKS